MADFRDHPAIADVMVGVEKAPNTIAGVDMNSSAARQLRLTPQQVQAVLAEKTAQFRASQAAERAEETAKAERAEIAAKAAGAAAPKISSAEARAKLEGLKNDPEWTARFFRGEIAARKEFSELTAAVAASSRTDAALTGSLPSPEIETVGQYAAKSRWPSVVRQRSRRS